MPTVDMEEPPSLHHYVLLFEEAAQESDGQSFSDSSLVYPDFRPSSLPTRRDSFSSLPPRRDSGGAFTPLDHGSVGFLPALEPGPLAFLRSRRDSNASLHSIPLHIGSLGGTRDGVVSSSTISVSRRCAWTYFFLVPKICTLVP